MRIRDLVVDDKLTRRKRGKKHHHQTTPYLRDPLERDIGYRRTSVEKPNPAYHQVLVPVDGLVLRSGTMAPSSRPAACRLIIFLCSGPG
ncbi:hypothetical protein GWI33_018628 [Rhynchophorus ferrugineus]|uniref:Uncharacterized protein n=1 Tax=Rhynchophorus ferrugineus TaxID=354439 RepID=A0A834HZR7_RHYFE|nr:hypothetical protein GWI33_018628 [Rhynchophorus ferrugineus]